MNLSLSKKSQTSKAFTLIELLVVISIISLLSSVVLASLDTARSKARDARRIGDLKQLEIALEFNYDKYGEYTQSEARCIDTSIGSPGCTASYGTGDWSANSDLRDLVDKDSFMSTLPKDPINNATYYYNYEVWNANQAPYVQRGQAYDLCARLEAGGVFCINKRT